MSPSSEENNAQASEPDLEELHRAVFRENQEPYEADARVPLWMVAGFAVLIGWGGWYLGRNDARFDTRVTDMHIATAAATGAPAAAGEAAAAPAVDGAQLYTSRCLACHQATGLGMPGLAPPLAGSHYVTDDETRLLKIVIFGLTGPIEVNGGTWDGAMPAWGTQMTDAEIAAVATHIRSTWGNSASAVSEETVAQVRKDHARSTPWTVSEL